jgi:hypothetical protein
MQMLYRLSYVGAFDDFSWAAALRDGSAGLEAATQDTDVAQRLTREDAPPLADFRSSKVVQRGVRAPESTDGASDLSMQNSASFRLASPTARKLEIEAAATRPGIGAGNGIRTRDPQLGRLTL